LISGELKAIIRDRHAFSELESLIRKPPHIRFRIAICAIKNPIVKKTASKMLFPLKNYRFLNMPNVLEKWNFLKEKPSTSCFNSKNH
jgi:hypothetical protein